MSPLITPGSGGRDRRPELLPAEILPLFDDRFVHTCDLYEEFIFRLALQVFRATGLEPHAAEPVDMASLAERAQLDPVVSRTPLDWLLRTLAARGLLESRGEPSRYRVVAPLPSLDPDEPLAAQRAHDPSALPAYRIAAVAAEHYPAFLRGQVTGEQILSSPESIDLWSDYFANSNSLYAINNAIGALAVSAWVGDRPLSILELGGGLASGAIALLDQLERSGRLGMVQRYLFTDVAPLFLRRGQRALAARFAPTSFLAARRLDMNAGFADQGVAPSSVDLVYAVNTLHVAHSLQRTLEEIRSSLKPGGQLIISECVRPLPEDAVHVEFVFNLLEPFRAPRLDPDLRPTPGFLTPEHWLASLEAAGFGAVRFLPDVRRIRAVYPSFVVGAIGATRG